MRIPEPKVLEELQQAPMREVTGIVGPWGANIGRAGEQPYTLQIDFDHWKLRDGGLISHQICICKQGAFAEFKPLRSSLKPYSILRVLAHVPESALLNATYALLVEIRGEDESDEELLRIAQQLREPVVLEDSRFGALRLDRLMKGYKGSPTWCSKPVQLWLGVAEDDDPKPALEAARFLWGAEQEWNQRMCDFAAFKLFDLSDRWRQSGDEAITEESFRKRLNLLEMIVFPNGKFQCWFNADGMFTDHAVTIHGSLSEGPTSAGLDG